MLNTFRRVNRYTNSTVAASTKKAGSAIIIMGTMSLWGLTGCGAEPAVGEAGELNDVAKLDASVSITSTNIHADSNKGKLSPTTSILDTITKPCANNADRWGGIQCLTNYTQYTRSELLNITGRNISMKVDQWDSHCGGPGHRVASTWTTVMPYDIVAVDFSAATAYGCREQWIINCKIDAGAGGYIPVNCSNVLVGSMITDYR